MSIKGNCHCGAVEFELDARPEWMTDCNCSICRRIGALWVHSAIDTITITAPPGATIRYIQGDRLLAVHSCRTCGCTTHWENLQKDETDHMAVNFRMVDPEITQPLRVRHFDGADSWKFLD